MGKLAEIVKNDHIQAATVSGLCIIILAYFYKRVLHIPVPSMEYAIPGLIFTIYEAARAKSRIRLVSRPLLWNLAMLLATAIIITVRLL